MSRGISIIRELRKKYELEIDKTVQKERQKVRESYDEAVKDLIGKIKTFVDTLNLDLIEVADVNDGYYRGNTIYVNYKLKNYDKQIAEIEKKKKELLEKLDRWEIEALKSLAKKEDIPEFSF